MCTRCILKKQYTVGEFCWQALARCTAACPASVSWRDSGLLISVVLTGTGGLSPAVGWGWLGSVSWNWGMELSRLAPTFRGSLAAPLLGPRLEMPGH